MVGKYVDLTESYKSLTEALHHSGFANDCKVEVAYVDSEQIEKDGVEKAIEQATKGLGADAILIPGGFGARGSEGKIEASQYAREQKIPFFGICLGLQMAVIEYARNVAGIEQATSSEFNPGSDKAVIDLMESQKSVSRMGGSMRLGAYPCVLAKGSLTAKTYGSKEISERHRHRFEFNNSYRDELTKAGLILSGTSPDNNLVEIIEIQDHPWFIGVQFHPEFKSSPRTPHPLFKGFIGAALEHRNVRIKGGRKLNSKAAKPSKNGRVRHSAASAVEQAEDAEHESATTS